MDSRNIFVIGLDPFNEALLRGLPKSDHYRFHDLLGYREAIRPTSRQIDLNELLTKAEERLSTFAGHIDAIIGYWDFPCSVIGPVLRQRYGLPGPRLESVAACEHKYWSRLEQRRVLPDLVPEFRAVDPFASDPLSKVDLPFPFWLKPIKAHSSYLGFKIESGDDFEACLPIIRSEIDHFGRPFDTFLAMLEMPEEVASIGGHYCIAEAIISQGEQCTLEGYAYAGDVAVYGVVDSIRTGQCQSSFSRYQYPSRVPRSVQVRMIDAAKQFIQQIGYDCAPFNMEFFWEPRTDVLSILEVNARISKSHCPIFKMVDGVSHHQVAIDLALGQRPNPPYRGGRFPLAAKFMERVFEDGVVETIPSAENLAAFHDSFPDAMLRILIHEGQRLAHLPYQDSYSFEIAEIFLGAETETALLDKYHAVLALLPFKFEEGGAGIQQNGEE